MSRTETCIKEYARYRGAYSHSFSTVFCILCLQSFINFKYDLIILIWSCGKKKKTYFVHLTSASEAAHKGASCGASSTLGLNTILLHMLNLLAPMHEAQCLMSGLE